MTQCTQTSFCFATPSRREVVARFDGGTITTDAGGLLLHRTEQKTGILRQFARCFRDYRNPERIDHSVPELVRQRVYGLALGYEDLNDHDQLRGDPLLAMLSGKADVEGRKAQRRHAESGHAARLFSEFRYRTLHSWSRKRRVVAKAECLRKGKNPRFVVTSLPARSWPAPQLYEQLYCARGEMENRIKEQQLDLFADRTSTALMRSNQIRLYFSSIAYGLLQALRELGLQGTKMARAQCSTIRVRLLKMGARVRVTARKVWISMATGHPAQALFAAVYSHLERGEPLRC